LKEYWNTLLVYSSCKDCITSHIGICEERGQEPSCPTCSDGPIKVGFSFSQIISVIDRLPPQSTDLVEILKKEKDPGFCIPASDPGPILRRNDFQSSTKLDALIQNLRWFLLASHSSNV
jgi:DNA repair protein RAD5